MNTLLIIQYLKLQITFTTEAFRLRIVLKNIKAVSEASDTAYNVRKDNDSLPLVEFRMLKLHENNSHVQRLSRGKFVLVSWPRDAVSHYKERKYTNGRELCSLP